MADELEAAAQTLTRALTQALGDDLVALMLYGSAARHARVEGRSDVNVLLVLKDTSAGTLDRAAPALAAWTRVAHALALIQSEADWAASADVFPIEIEDIRDANRLLAGRDVISALTTTRAHLRHELEREARGKVIRLRAEYAATAADGARLGELLAQSLGTFVVLFRAGLRLGGAPVPREADAVVKAAAGIAGFDAGAFDWALAARQKKTAPALGRFDPIAARYLEAVERFVAWVNDVK